MRSTLSALTLLSVFLIQIHGLFHLDIVSHDKNHHCEICEVVSHNPSLALTTLAVDISFQVIAVKLLPIFDELFFPHIIFLTSNGPRAPPII